MKNSIDDRNLVRQYLLGRLDEQAEVEEDVSERILFVDDMTDIVDSVEDDIIEEYLDGLLVSADRIAVDTYFLQAPERKEKLRFAKLLRDYCETKPSQDSVTQRGSLGRPPLAWRSYFRTYGQLAALLLVTLSGLIYLAGIRRDHARLQAELLEERERSASLGQQAELLQPPMVALTLVNDRSRGAGASIPQVEIKSSTRRMIVDIALQGGVSGAYEVRLEAKGAEGPLWSARLLPIVSPNGDTRLVFDVPTRNIRSDVYSFVVLSASPKAVGSRHYDFQVNVAR